MSIAQTEMATLVDALRAVVKRDGITRATLLEFATGGLESPVGQMGYAILKHAQDILRATPNASEEDLFVEAYRRTLFDAETAALYGTEALVPADAATAHNMIAYISLRQTADERGVAYTEGTSTAH
jgi:hypothetical protein